MKAKITLSLIAAVLVSVTVGCAGKNNIIHPGAHLDAVDHVSVGDICHSHAEMSVGHHCHDLLSGKTTATAWN